jgi:HPt (histidine-containing phosphotransfer) domain-containing protein
MNGFLTKPIDHARLMAEVAVALKSGCQAAPKEAPMENPVQYLRETLGDDTAEAVITVFCAESPNLLRRLREHASAGAGAAVAREAHALAGTAGAVGLISLAEEARAMERSARRDHVVPDETTINALESHLNSAIAVLHGEPVP